MSTLIFWFIFLWAGAPTLSFLPIGCALLDCFFCTNFNHYIKIKHLFIYLFIIIIFMYIMNTFGKLHHHIIFYNLN